METFRRRFSTSNGRIENKVAERLAIRPQSFAVAMPDGMSKKAEAAVKKGVNFGLASTKLLKAERHRRETLSTEAGSDDDNEVWWNY